MKTLDKWPASLLVHGGVLEMLFTILLCYILAVVNGHVPVWLPMISDCGVYAPEKYLFRLGFVVGASLMAFQVVITYNVNKSSALAKPMAVIAVIASAGLAILSVVNEVENGRIHLISSVTFFAGYDVYALFTLYVSWSKRRIYPLGYGIKCVTAVIGNFAFIGYMACRFLDLNESMYLAMFEWSNTFAIMGFLWSAVLDDLKNVEIAEIQEDTDCFIADKHVTIIEKPMKLKLMKA